MTRIDISRKRRWSAWYFPLLGIVLAASFAPAQATTDTYASSTTWVAPAGVTSVDVEVWGGGGAGGGQNLGSDGGGGGGGGAYSKKVSIPVTPGTSYTVSVGTGGAGVTSGTGGAGGDSYFISTSTVLAKGGAGGAPSTGTPPAGGVGGAAASGVGDTRYSGGNGGKGRDNSNGQGGPGGSSAGSAATGTSGADPWSTTTAAAAPAGGGIGGNGGAAGANGSAPASGNGGGGGGSGDGTSRTGGAGAPGKVAITYLAPPAVTTTAATVVTKNGATLNGSVTSNDATTAATFDYGLTAAYGSTVAASPASIAASTTATAISKVLSGLVCGTLYHYRAVGVSSAGTTRGADMTFTTSACPTVVSITAANANPNTVNATVSWTVLFDTSVSGVDATDFVLVPGGGAMGAAITSVSGSGTTWTVSASTGTAYGTLGLNLVDNDSIVDAAGGPLGGVGAGNGNFTGQVYTLAPPAPVLSKMSSTAAAVVGDVVTFTISVINPYSMDMTGLTVSDVLPTGMVYATHAATIGSVTVSGQTVTWNIPTLLAGGTAQLTLAVKLTQKGALNNTVTSPGASSASASVLVLASAVTHFHLDETAGSWNGTAKEVIDSGGNATSGYRRATSTPTTTNTVSPSPTIASQYPSVVGGFCNAARFTGDAVVEVPHSTAFDYTTTLSASAWIYPTAYPTSDLYSILSNDTNYEFHLDTNGKLYWWWNAATLTSSAKIPLNTWTHIAITMDSTAGGGRQRIYINGVADANTNNWKGALVTNPCPFYIGGDINTAATCNPPNAARNFRGMIDEVKLYGYELSQAEVQADMNLGRNCSGSTYDHIRIEHDGSGSVCTPEVVTVKACLTADCSTLYPGNVTVNMSVSPTGSWAGGNQLVLANGVGTMTLNNSTSGNVTLGTSSAVPTAANATRCFVGSTETCTMNFASASCAFDAVEPGANPKTRLFTKLAGADFKVDVMAVSGSAVNTGYTGTVKADLVDASASTCPTGTGLTSVQSLVFAAADAGRKSNVTFNYATPMRDVRVRMQVGSGTPACSSDNFAIRPSSVTLGTTPAMATGPSATATPVVKAGGSFALNATATAGYAGSLTLDSTRLTAQTTTQDTSVASGGVVGTLKPATLTANAAPAPTANASYDEVGYVYLAAGAYQDSTFTAVDQPTGCSATGTCDCVTDTTNNNHLSTSIVGATGRYGCTVGSTSAALGRFIPDHFLVTPGTAVNRRLAACSAVSPFSYTGEELQLKDFKLTAVNGNATPATTSNYTGVFARFDGATVGNFGLAAVDLADTIAPMSATAFASGSGAGQFQAVSSSGSWSAGVGTFSANVRLNRAAAPDGPYESFRVGAEPVDSDGVGVLAASKNLDTSAPADATNDKVLLGSTKVRFGRVRLQNLYGSEKLQLPIPVQAQYWNASAFVLNTDDSCTAVAVPTARTLTGTVVPDGLPNLYFYPVGGKNLLTSADTAASATSPLAAGVTALTFTKPGKAGWLDIILDVPDYLKDNWGNCLGQSGTAGLRDDFPCARATFGVYKSPLIYRRENY